MPKQLHELKCCPYCEYHQHGQCQAIYTHQRFTLVMGLNPIFYNVEQCIEECCDYMEQE